MEPAVVVALALSAAALIVSVVALRRSGSAAWSDPDAGVASPAGSPGSEPDLRAMVRRLDRDASLQLEEAVGRSQAGRHAVGVEAWLLELATAPGPELERLLEALGIDRQRVQDELAAELRTNIASAGPGPGPDEHTRAPTLTPDVVEVLRLTWMRAESGNAPTRVRPCDVLHAIACHDAQDGLLARHPSLDRLDPRAIRHWMSEGGGRGRPVAHAPAPPDPPGPPPAGT